MIVQNHAAKEAILHVLISHNNVNSVHRHDDNCVTMRNESLIEAEGSFFGGYVYLLLIYYAPIEPKMFL